MSDWDERAKIVLDNGSGVVKAGYGGEEKPRAVFQAVVGQSRSDPSMLTIGDEALEARGVTLRYPLEHGIVVHWDDMERVWQHMYTQLGANSHENAVLMTEAPLNPKVNREKMFEIFFEHFHVPAMHVQIQAVMALYTSGRTGGLVVDSGDGVTHTVPVYDGYSIPTAIRRLDLAGRDFTEWMMELLNDQNDLGLSTTADREVARKIKEDCCYVAHDFDTELEKFESDPEGMAQNYTLPDGRSIKVGMAAVGCPELFFNPAIASKPCHSLQNTCFDSMMACPIDMRRELYHNVVMSGGSTMFRNLDERLTSELRKKIPPGAADELRVIAPPERKYSVWMGAAVLASLSTFLSEYITAQEYQESGVAIVHQRCGGLGFVTK